YHKAHDYVTEKCIHMKDAIDILTRDGHLKQFFKKKDNPRLEPREASAVEEEKPAAGGK
ncbi:hypothetical protein A2U01_0086427, partial [Trifolium medium]|nr:hypothetical protein [Trifolium medium]